MEGVGLKAKALLLHLFAMLSLIAGMVALQPAAAAQPQEGDITLQGLLLGR